MTAGGQGEFYPADAVARASIRDASGSIESINIVHCAVAYTAAPLCRVATSKTCLRFYGPIAERKPRNSASSTTTSSASPSGRMGMAVDRPLVRLRPKHCLSNATPVPSSRRSCAAQGLPLQHGCALTRTAATARQRPGLHLRAAERRAACVRQGRVSETPLRAPAYTVSESDGAQTT